MSTEENAMSGSEETKPTEQRGGAPPGEQEAREKGPWAARASEGVVPPELGGSDAPDERLPEDPELGSEVLGRPASSRRPPPSRASTRTAEIRPMRPSRAGPSRPPAASRISRTPEAARARSTWIRSRCLAARGRRRAESDEPTSSRLDTQPGES